MNSESSRSQACPRPRVFGRGESIFGAFAQAKPNSLFNGVQIGTITYSYRDMPDQSAEATLKYILDSGISAVELMGGPVESFAGAPSRADVAAARRRPAAAADGGGADPDGAAAAVHDRSWNGPAVQPGARAVTQPARGKAAVAVAAAAAARRRPRQQAAQREAGATSSRRGARRSRWTSSSSCARCTTTPA